MKKSSRSPAPLPRFAELDADYEILRELGRGGTAVVYLARERELGRLVAIKVIRTAYIQDDEAAARLVREARLVGKLQHPNIVVLYGTRRLRDGSRALIMQYVEGRTLKEEIQAHGALPVRRVEQVLGDLGSALAHAHRRRIVHRDIKPENVYIDESGVARLSDFGIARSWGTDSSLTLPGAAIGTPAYMSPEQIDGAGLDGRSDLYALGLVGWEMLTGRRPWAGESLYGIIYKQKHEHLPALADERPALPAALVRAIEGALQKNPEDRWPDAETFLAVLGDGRAQPRPFLPATGADLPDGDTGQEIDGAAFHVSEPDPDALTIQYRRPGASPKGDTPPSRQVAVRTVTRADTPVGAEAVEPEKLSAGVPRLKEDALPGEAERPAVEAGPPPVILAPPGEWPTLEPEPVAAALRARAEERATAGATRKRRRKLLVTAVLGLFLVGTAVLMGINQWGAARPGAIGPADAAAAPNTAPPPAVNPAVVPIASGMTGVLQEGVVGDILAEPLVVRVVDPSGTPLTGVPVRFVVLSGESAVTPATAETGADGTVEARWVPAEAGLHVLEAQLAETQGVAARFQARVAARPPSRVTRVSPDRYRGTAGTAVPAPLVVRVEDDRGAPVPGVTVRFAVRAGEGRVEPEVVTGSDGTASSPWVLGSGETQEVVATLADFPADSIRFHATSGPAPLAVRRAITAGGTHSCMLAASGGAECWGGNDSGQLGDGSGARRATPAEVRGPEPFAALSAGVSHTCAVGVSGTAFCWGANTAGQLGDGGRAGRTQPVAVRSDQRFTTVVAGMSHSCGINAAGQLFCWGRNSQGQLGDGTRTSRSTPVRVGGGRAYRSVALGWAHTCAITRDGAAYCWGRNAFGELGDGTRTERDAPTAVAGDHRFTALAAGSGHTCGLRTDGAVMCWGHSAQGQLGNGTQEDSPIPVQVQSRERFAALAAGGVHTCALTADGAAYCWGRNNYGQLGDGSFQDRARPSAVDTERRFTSLNASGAHTCATATSGQDFCWGFNLDGQLGDGSRSNRAHPVIVRREG